MNADSHIIYIDILVLQVKYKKTRLTSKEKSDGRISIRLLYENLIAFHNSDKLI